MLDPDTNASNAKNSIFRCEGEDRETPIQDRVGIFEKCMLGIGQLPVFMAGQGLKTLVQNYYNMILHVDPAKLGLILALPRLWDAITDPIAGFISDNFHSRFGRRKPLIVVGALLQGIAFGLIWMAQDDWSEDKALVYLIATLLFFYTCFTIFSVPLVSLSYEMTPDYKERTRVSVFGALFGKVGELGYGWILALAQLSVFGSVVFGMKVVGWGVGIVIMGLVALLPGIFVKERYYKKDVTKKRVKFWPSLRESFSSRAFRILMVISCLQIVAGMFASSLDSYLITYYMFDGVIADGWKWKAMLSSAYAIIGMLSLYPVNWAANKYGKRSVLIFSFFLVLLGSAGKWFLFTPGNPWKLVFDPVLCGPIWTALAVLMPSMLADICDEDELKYGYRREGMYGAVFSWFQKTGFSLAFFGSGLALNWAGFDASREADQDAAAILNLRLILAVSTFVWAVLAIGVLIYYPLSKQKAYETRDALEKRRGAIQ